jgi:hypothetical protein
LTIGGRGKRDFIVHSFTGSGMSNFQPATLAIIDLYAFSIASQRSTSACVTTRENRPTGISGGDHPDGTTSAIAAAALAMSDTLRLPP